MSNCHDRDRPCTCAAKPPPQTANTPGRQPCTSLHGLKAHLKDVLSSAAAQAVSLFLLGLIRMLTGSQARWWGCPPKAEQRIYFANHQSHADLVMIWAALPKELRHGTRAVAARDYWTKTPFRQWLTTAVFNVIYVSRERNAQEDPLEPLMEALHAGDSLILFPEGTGAIWMSLRPSKLACTTWLANFRTLSLFRPGLPTCSASCPKVKWFLYRCCAR